MNRHTDRRTGLIALPCMLTFKVMLIDEQTYRQTNWTDCFTLHANTEGNANRGTDIQTDELD